MEKQVGLCMLLGAEVKWVHSEDRKEKLMLFLPQYQLDLVPSLGSLSWQPHETFFQTKGKGRSGEREMA